MLHLSSIINKIVIIILIIEVMFKAKLPSSFAYSRPCDVFGGIRSLACYSVSQVPKVKYIIGYVIANYMTDHADMMRQILQLYALGNVLSRWSIEVENTLFRSFCAPMYRPTCQLWWNVSIHTNTACRNWMSHILMLLDSCTTCLHTAVQVWCLL